MDSIQRARDALSYIDPSCSREEWIKVGMAAKSAGLAFEDFHSGAKMVRITVAKKIVGVSGLPLMNEG